MYPIGASKRRLLNQSPHLRFSHLTAAMVFYGPSRCRKSVLGELDTRHPRILPANIEHAPWKLDRLKVHHEPSISLETYERIQARKAGRMLAPVRVDIKGDFPLRGAVCCAKCAHPLTSCWSRSATASVIHIFGVTPNPVRCFARISVPRKSTPRLKLFCNYCRQPKA